MKNDVTVVQTKEARMAVSSGVSGEIDGAFEIWKTIKLGLHKSADAYKEALRATGRRLSGWASDIVGKPEFAPEFGCASEQMEVDLVVVSVKELGFMEPVRYDEVCARAEKLGLALCPAEVGPALRLVYGDQPFEEWLAIAMQAIQDSGCFENIFCLEHDEAGLSLDATDGHADYDWHPEDQLVFQLPRM